MKLFFNTINKDKQKEIVEICADQKIAPNFFEYEIREILSEKLEDVILKKSIMAYEACHVPIIVEHGALHIQYLKGLPGALSKPIWDILDDSICKIIPPVESRSAKACSAVCYCDGKKRNYFIECTDGEVSFERKGKNGFQWDPIFIPNGSKKTYAEMELNEKLEFSQAKKAYLKLFEHLKK